MNLPEQICVQCLSDLNVAYQFRMNCESSAAILNSILESATIPQTSVPEISVSLGTGEVYKFLPPTGLNIVHRNQSDSETQKDEIITDSLEGNDETIEPKVETQEDENYYITADFDYDTYTQEPVIFSIFL